MCPTGPFGWRLPNRRQYASRYYHFVGYILQFDPAAYANRSSVRAALGYDHRPLIVCSIGGTTVGRELLELCAAAYLHIREQVRDVRMVLVCGPRLDLAAIKAPAGVEVRGYLPRLFEHLAACDLAIVQGGGTTTLELTALRRPFIYFPLQGTSSRRSWSPAGSSGSRPATGCATPTPPPRGWPPVPLGCSPATRPGRPSDAMGPSGLRAECAGSGVGFSVVIPGFVTGEGIFARHQTDGVRAPAFFGTTTPQQVARAVVQAIRRDAPELLVTPRPLRPFLALAALAPRTAERLAARVGVTPAARSVARLHGRLDDQASRTGRFLVGR